MEAMVGVPGCRRILIVVVAQLLLLTVAAVVSAVLITTLPPATFGMPAQVLTWIILPLSAFLGVFTVMSVLSEPIEQLWSINAKARLKRWVFPSLVGGGALALLAYGVKIVSGFGIFWPGLIEIAAFVVPIAGLSLVALNGLRRYMSVSRGASGITQSLISLAPDTDGLARVRSSFDTEMGRSTTNVRPNPQGFTLAGLTSRPFHDPRDFHWMRAFEEQADEIRTEAEGVLRLHQDKIDIYKYPGLDGEKWKAFSLVARRRPNAINLAACPVTADLLKTVPGYPVFRDAMFSILGPGGEITPHRDVANIYLTAHLGLRVPGNGFIEVAGDRREWCENKFVVFDSSYEHRAVNASSKPRVILLIDFLHPEVTPIESEWVNRVGI
jgi:beta-hydroxylase